jgi:hypothetical protein
MAEMGSYLNLLETYPGPYGTPTIPPGLIQGVRAEAKANSKMLQIVDVCAGALNNALEPNRYGEVDDSYLKVLAPKLRRYNGQLWGYGLKLFPGNYQDCMTRISQYRWMADL